MRWIKLFFVSVIAILLSACKPEQPAANTIRVGIIAGPQIQIMEVAKKVAAKQGLNIKVLEFSDYTMPNAALAEGSIDANIFQHQPYLDSTVAAKKYHLTTLAKTFIYPMGAYSNKIKKLDQLADKAVIAIPNDPSNEARALLLLQKMGLIKLKADVGHHATNADVIANPKQLQIKPLDAAQLPRVLADVDLAVINDDYAVPAGLFSKDALYVEDKDSPYANIIVVRSDEQNNEKLKKLVTIMHTPEIVDAAKEVTKGQAIPAW